MNESRESKNAEQLEELLLLTEEIQEELEQKNCWDVITLLMILTSAVVIIYFGESIKKVMPINLLFLLLFIQGIYLGIRCYLNTLYWTNR